MKQLLRFALNLLSPAVISAALISVAQGAGWGRFCFFLIYALTCAFFPSLVHAVIMAVLYEAGMSPVKKRAVVVSSASGLAFGLLIAGCLGLLFGVADARLWYTSMAIVGALTGAFNGTLILGLERMGLRWSADSPVA